MSCKVVYVEYTKFKSAVKYLFLRAKIYSITLYLCDRRTQIK